MSKRHAPRGKIKAAEDAPDLAETDQIKPKGGRESAILALLSEKTVTAAAARCGVSRSTLKTWLKDDGFKAQLEAARAGAFKTGMDRLVAYQEKAIDRLFSLIEQKEFPSTALSGVKDVLDRTMGKPIEKVEMNVSGELAVVVSRLAAARQRLAAKREPERLEA